MAVKQRYRVIDRVAAGGMAEVFRGKAVSVEGIEKEVAIKRVLPSLTRKKKFLDMFLDEARLSMRLNHANIAQVFDVGRADDTYFIVMEFVDGVNLRRLFQRASERGYRFPLKAACYIITEVCRGLAHSHEVKDENGRPMGIVHRDISPPNILVSRAGEVKLVDFGLAKAVTQVALTDPGVVKGKFSYLSPEAANGLDVDHRADIFSTGIVLFELLTNRQLFRGRTDVDTLELVRRAAVPDITKLNPEVPESFNRILQKALAKDPGRRYSSAREMADDLSQFLFDNNLKVTSYDLEALYRRLVEEQPGASPEDHRRRIEDLIEEEILNLSMIGHLTEITTEGSRPINAENLHIDLSSRYDFSDVWKNSAGESDLLSAEPEASLDLGLEEGLTERLEGDEPTLEETVEARRRRQRDESGGNSLWITLLTAGLLLAAIAVAVYLLLTQNT